MQLYLLLYCSCGWTIVRHAWAGAPFSIPARKADVNHVRFAKMVCKTEPLGSYVYMHVPPCILDLHFQSRFGQLLDSIQHDIISYLYSQLALFS